MFFIHKEICILCCVKLAVYEKVYSIKIPFKITLSSGYNKN